LPAFGGLASGGKSELFFTTKNSKDIHEERRSWCKLVARIIKYLPQKKTGWDAADRTESEKEHQGKYLLMLFFGMIFYTPAQFFIIQCIL